MLNSIVKETGLIGIGLGAKYLLSPRGCSPKQIGIYGVATIGIAWTSTLAFPLSRIPAMDVRIGTVFGLGIASILLGREIHNLVNPEKPLSLRTVIELEVKNFLTVSALYAVGYFIGCLRG